jgi:ABC-type branched-subunit amino acid transport system ATPase component
LPAETYLLQVTDLTKRFGGLLALDHVNLQLREGGIHGVIGPNGAGKSTLFNLISGIISPTSGLVRFRGSDLRRVSTNRIAKMGIARSFQTPRIFPKLTVWENVALASPDSGRCREALRQTWLADRKDLEAASLSHGERKRLDMAQALAREPQLLLLDEPTAGMNANETRDMADLVRALGAERTVIVIEHDIEFVRQLAQRVTVLDRGRVLFEGTVSEVIANAQVRDRYLGETVGLT